MARGGYIPGISFAYISEEDAKEYQKQFDRGGITACEAFVSRKLEEWRTVQINIGVVGNSGTGKSSFINAVRGLTADDEGAASVGTTETTRDIKAYAHPNNPLMKFWDLPGVGTPNFPRDDYLQKIRFNKYDFFLIMSSDRFTENDKFLASAISSTDKQFFFVRTKIDHNIRDDKYDHPKTHDSKRVLAVIRQNIRDNLGSLYDEERVFLVANHQHALYDFGRLEESLVNSFLALKQEAMILSLNALSEGMVKKKVEKLRRFVWLKCSLLAISPDYGVSAEADTAILISQGNCYFKQLGLDEESLVRTARVMKCDPSILKPIVASHHGRLLTAQGISDLAAHIPSAVLATSWRTLARTIPILGSLITVPMSFISTYAILNEILTRLEEVAVIVMRTAVELSASTAEKMDDDEEC